MDQILSEIERAKLIRIHNKERDKRIADRIKAVLLSDEGRAQSEIAKVLFIEESTVQDLINAYKEDKVLSDHWYKARFLSWFS